MSWSDLAMGMFDSLLRPRKAASPPPPLTPAEAAVVIGDIHGSDGLLARLLARPECAAGGSRLVVLGDIIDRGEDSAAVVARLMALERQRPPGAVICLMGNHERMMLDFLDAPVERGARWLRAGGLQTLASFGIGGASEAIDGPGRIAVAAALRAGLPEGVETWLRSRPLSFRNGNLWAVHAGADPGVPMDEQDPKHLLCGHPDFATTARNDGLWLAYGHVIQSEAGFRDHQRIALDTGAFATGRLAALAVAPGAAPRLFTA